MSPLFSLWTERRRVPVAVLLTVLSTVLLTVIACTQVMATYGVFSQTIDEALHIATGLEWWQRGTYRLQPENPPLGRIAIALGPHLAGMSAIDTPAELPHLLRTGTSYRETLARARLGSLPFFVAAAALVWLWARRLYGHWVALAACGLFVTLPPVLAHAGLATTDMAATATLFGALFALLRWLENATPGRSLTLGLAVGLALATKFSAYLFLAVCGLAIVAARRYRPSPLCNGPSNAASRRWLGGLVMAAGVAALLVWTVYQFSFGPVLTDANRPHRFIDRWVSPGSQVHQLAYNIVEMSTPAPEHFVGLDRLRVHSNLGHLSYLLGEVSTTGHWAFFPVALATKTPLPFLLLSAFGIVALARSTDRDWRHWVPALSAGAMLVAVLPSPLAIGLRHILPIYPLLSLLAGLGCIRLWQLSRWPIVSRGLVGGLLLWQAVGVVSAHPDYLPWFNELAGDHPETILVDSDLDWGQDLLRLERELAARQIDQVSLALFTSAELAGFDFPPYRLLAANERAEGWVAASLMRIKVWPDHAWLEAFEPVAQIGASIRLYHLPPAIDPSSVVEPGAP